MSLANYSDLQASIANWMHRSDLTAVIPDFVVMAESRIARDLRLRKQMTMATLTCTPDSELVSLPADWLEFENVTVSASPDRQIIYVPIEHIGSKYSSESSGMPAVYSIEGDYLVLAPKPDSAYPLPIIYYARFPSVTTNGTNWLLTNHPNVYLFASLIEAAQYAMNNEMVQVYTSRYNEGLQRLQAQDEMSQSSGSALRVKVI